MSEYTPEVKVVTVDGIVVVQCVNWQDYNGWECRIAEDPAGHVEARVLGHVYQREDRWGQTSWNVRGTDHRGFISIEGAIASML